MNTLIASNLDALAMHLVFFMVGGVIGWQLHRFHGWMARKFSA